MSALKLVHPDDDNTRQVFGPVADHLTEAELAHARTTLLGSAYEQTHEAKTHLTADLSHEPLLPWVDLEQITGPMLRGDLWIVLARPENGKTAFCLNVTDKLASQGHAVTYFGTEEVGQIQRLRVACLRTGLPPDVVIAGKWHLLDDPEQAKRELSRALDQIQAEGRIYFAPDTRPSMRSVEKAAQEAVDLGCRVLVLDHFHRMAITESPNLTHTKAETVRAVKELGLDHQLTVVMAAQVRRSENPLLKYYPPSAESGMDTSALEQEASVLLGLWRPLKRGLEKADEARFLRGEVDATAIVRPNTMAIRVLKHRLNSDHTGRTAYLHVERGLLCNQYRVT